jgi:hypothetical protein
MLLLPPSESESPLSQLVTVSMGTRSATSTETGRAIGSIFIVSRFVIREAS